jgi:uroporphyrin-III C-methyltransferase/precorrin-2 dehydrogenase/sirohydrochlorin ferrochelatase
MREENGRSIMSGEHQQGWLHPIFIDLTGHPVIVVGGGTVAERKIETLVESGAQVTVVSPEVTGLIARWGEAGRITLHRRAYLSGDLRGFRLAYAATPDQQVNRAVRLEARAEGVWLNAVDEPDLCDFITPAIVRRGSLTIAVSTNGRCPALSRRIREDLERQFGPEYAEAVEQLGELRDRTRAATGTTAGIEARVAEVLAALPGCGAGLQPSQSRATPGKVYLVGAGPGDPELLTVKGRRLLESADTVVYDALVDSRLLELCRPSTTRVYVGKRDRHHTRPQAEINSLLIDEARAGRIVVRLKGGDPFIFGRGGEEVEALGQAGIAYEIVPGVSAGVAVPAYAGIPLTHRDFTSELVFLTGHECVTNPSPVNWTHYAKSSASLVIFMGLHNLGAIARQLLEHGRDARCPVAIIENGTTDAQRTIVAPLSKIADEAVAAGIQPPALIVIGEVVGLRDKLNWFEPTLAGHRRVKETPSCGHGSPR